MTTFEQQIAIDKAMEALTPLVQASADAGVNATIGEDVSEAMRILDKAYVALAVASAKLRKAQSAPVAGI